MKGVFCIILILLGLGCVTSLPTQYACPDGSNVSDPGKCLLSCGDGTFVRDKSTCPDRTTDTTVQQADKCKKTSVDACAPIIDEGGGTSNKTDMIFGGLNNTRGVNIEGVICRAVSSNSPTLCDELSYDNVWVIKYGPDYMGSTEYMAWITSVGGPTGKKVQEITNYYKIKRKSCIERVGGSGDCEIDYQLQYSNMLYR